MNFKSRGKVIFTITVAIVVIAAAVPLFYYYEREGRNDMLYAGEPPFYPSTISLQFLNPNGSDESKTLVSVYVYTPDMNTYPQTGE